MFLESFLINVFIIRKIEKLLHISANCDNFRNKLLSKSINIFIFYNNI